MYCERCGKEISAEGNPRFCTQCGIQELNGVKPATGKTAGSSAPAWMKGCLITFGIVALLVTLFVAHAIHRSNSNTKKEAQIKANMVEYLNKKYKKEFVVGKLTKENRRVWSWYEGRAYLKENREIAFWVRSSSENDNLFSDTDYHGSSYGYALWSYQLKQDVVKILDNIYGTNYKLINCNYDATGKENWDSDTDLNYMDKTNKCKCGSIEITYKVLTNNDFNKNIETDKILKLIKAQIQEEKLNEYSLYVAYTNMSQFNDNTINGYISVDNLKRYISLNGGKINFVKIKRERWKDNNLKPITGSEIMKSFKEE